MMDYTPINYNSWILGEEAKKGANLKRLSLLKDFELKIFKKSIPYQDSRNDPGHGEIATYFVLKLLDFLPGNRDIVVPATISHDIGWYGNNPNAWKELIEKYKDNLQALETEAMRRPHQNRGILLTGRILERVGYFEIYPVENWLEIADIIGDHDTKILPATENGKILRIADFLWRATYPCVQIYMSGFTPAQVKKRIEETCLNEPSSPLGELESEIARIELANTLYFKFGEKQAREVLKQEYADEIEKIVDFYA